MRSRAAVAISCVLQVLSDRPCGNAVSGGMAPGRSCSFSQGALFLAVWRISLYPWSFWKSVSLLVYFTLFQTRSGDADPGRQDPCVVATMNKFTWTTEILWKKRDGMPTL